MKTVCRHVLANCYVLLPALPRRILFVTNRGVNGKKIKNELKNSGERERNYVIQFLQTHSVLSSVPGTLCSVLAAVGCFCWHLLNVVARRSNLILLTVFMYSFVLNRQKNGKVSSTEMPRGSDQIQSKKVKRRDCYYVFEL